MDRIDTEALLSTVDLVGLIGRRVDLKRQGTEYRGACPFHGGEHRNFAVVPRKGFYHCHVCHANGTAIDWLMHWEGIEFKEACRQLGSGIAGPAVAREATPPKRITGTPPKGSTPPSISTQHWGDPVRRWLYRDAQGQVIGAVDRYEYEEDGARKKVTPQITWGSKDEGRSWDWGFGHWNTPRPLYGLDTLAQRPAAQVLVVEGEKSAEAAQALLPSWAVVTWPGGGGAVDAADWTPLTDRNVILWPDADSQPYRTPHPKAGEVKPYDEQPGVLTMRRLAVTLQGVASKVRILDVGLLDGWDAADALAEGWDTKRTVAYMRERVREVATDTPPPAPPPSPTISRGGLTLSHGGAQPQPPAPEQPAPEPGDAPRKPFFQVWTDLNLELNGKGIPFQDLAGVVRVLERHPDTAGRIWYDRFYRRIYTDAPLLGGEAHEIANTDTLALTVWLQETLGLRRVGDTLTDKAISTIAGGKRRSAAEEWLRGLAWDGRPRLAEAMGRYFGAGQSAYTKAVGENFFRSMVARVLQPGCQCDYMVVFEGTTGIYKSQALKIIGGPWHTEMRHDVDSANFYTALHGKILVEFPELRQFGKASLDAIKACLTTQTDRHRMPYERRDEDYPRQNVFVATTNRSAYLDDPHGNRRFWPIRCSVIDLKGLERDRDQLFAEAVIDYNAGAPWHVMPDEATLREQSRRRNADVWQESVEKWIAMRLDGTSWVHRPEPLREVSIPDILTFAIGLQTGKWGRVEQRRVTDCLLAKGWVQVEGSSRFRWEGE